MAGNSERIDDVVDPVALKQVQDLTDAAGLLEKQFIDTAKAASQLNALTGNSRSFKDYNTNATRAATETAKLQQAQQNLARAALLTQQAQQRLVTATTQSTAAQQRLATATTQSAAAQQRLEAQTARNAAAQARATAATVQSLSPYQSLLNVYKALTEEARNAGVQFGITSRQFIETSNQANGVRTRLDSIDNTLGHSQRNVGNYTNAFAAGFGKVYGAIRVAANILPGLGISGIFLLLFEGIKALTEKLELFNQTLSKTEIQQQSFQQAISGDGYKEAVKNITELTVNLELAKKGFIDKDRVIDEYNDSIGKVTGNVDTLAEAEKGLSDNADKFIKATLLKAAAEIVLADASKEAAETALKNQKLTDDIADARNNRFTLSGFLGGGFNAGNSQSQNAAERIKKDQDEIENNNSKLKKTFDNRLAVIKDFDKQQVDLLGKDKASAPGTAPGVSNVATLNNKIVNLDLEYNKNIQKQIMDDSKKSYSDRLKAADIYYTAQKHLLENNKNLAISDTRISNNQQLEIIKEFTNSYQEVEIEQDKNRRQLQSDATKDQIALQQQRLATSKKSEEAIIADQEASLEIRFKAIATYGKIAKEAANLASKSEIQDAGDNSTKIRTIREKLKADLADINKEIITKTAEVTKQANAALLKEFKDGEANQKQILQNSLEVEVQYTRQRKQDAQDSSDDQLQILANQYSKGLISAQEYQKKKKDIESGTTVNQDQIDVDGLKMRISIEKSLGEDSLSDQEKLAIAERKLAKDTAAAEIAAAEDVANRKKELRTKEKELADAGFTLIQTIVDSGYQNQLNAIQGQKDALDKQTAAQIDAENRSLDSTANKADKIAIINAKAAAQQNILDERQRAVKQKQAQADRLFAIAKIIENTAIGVTSALAEYPPNIPLAIIVGALGAVQLATTLATPIPKYQYGTDSAKGGVSLVGEVGKEYVIQPDGDAYFTPSSPTLMNIPKGSKVISNMELMSIMSNPFKQRANISGNDNRKMIEAINNGTNKTVRALRNNRQKAPIILVDTMKAGKFNDYRNNHFR